MDKPLTARIRPDDEPLDSRGYAQVGGWEGLRAALRLEPLKITEMVKQSNLRGRGGAGFPTGTKWSVVPMGKDAPRPKYLVVNADEMEPGTFKDRILLEGDPLQMLEGMVIAAYAVQANIGFIFLRQEYQLAHKRLKKAIGQAHEYGVIGKNILNSGFDFTVHLHLSAGRYICGEETGLLNALEGKRANPRSKPPYPQVCGLWGKPTVVQNVETVCNLPHILQKGPDWFRQLSHGPNGGTKIFGVSGRVCNPGWWELPLGTPLRELIEQHAGGMQPGYQLRGLLPGGASTDFITPENLDVAMDFGALEKIGSRLGTGTVVVLDDQTCPVGMVRNLIHFFAQESCGLCTPCWSGLSFCEQILDALENGEARPGDLEVLDFQTKFNAMHRTFCALAPGAMEPLQSALQHYAHIFSQHLHDGYCPWRQR